MEQEKYIDQLVKQCEAIIEFGNELKAIDQKRLLYRPAPDKWNVLEVIKHINLYSDYYLEELGNVIDKASSTSPKKHYKSGWMGNYFANSMLPKEGQIKNKMKTFKDKDTLESSVNSEEIEKFILQHREFMKLLEKSRSIDLSVRNRITISSLIRLKLGDTFRFLFNHVERHELQISNIINEA